MFKKEYTEYNVKGFLNIHLFNLFWRTLIYSFLSFVTNHNNQQYKKL